MTATRRRKHSHHLHARNENDTEDHDGATSRRWFTKHLGILLGASTGAAVAGSLPSSWMNPTTSGPSTNAVAHAAPPIAVIAEELGYFPVTNADHETVCVPKCIKRESSKQAIQLARKLRDSGTVVAWLFCVPIVHDKKNCLVVRLGKS